MEWFALHRRWKSENPLFCVGNLQFYIIIWLMRNTIYKFYFWYSQNLSSIVFGCKPLFLWFLWKNFVWNEPKSVCLSNWWIVKQIVNTSDSSVQHHYPVGIRILNWTPCPIEQLFWIIALWSFVHAPQYLCKLWVVVM